MDYKIVDDFLPQNEFEMLESMMANLPWFLVNGVAYADDASDNYFLHMLYENSRPNSEYFERLFPVLAKLDIKSLIRVKANLYTRNTQFIEHGKHEDFKFPHKAFILYLNTNNGFTRMSDGTVVNSVANRGVFFNGHEPHNSTNCTDQPYRMNISINYF